MTKFYSALFVEWYGPFRSISEAADFTAKEMSGIYAMFDYSGERRGRPPFQYVGISDNLYRRLKQHEVDSEWNAASIWLGDLEGGVRSDWGIAEWILVHGLGPLGNDKKHTKPPQTVSLVNRFWKPEAAWEGDWTKQGRAQKPSYVPDVMYYDEFDEEIFYINLDAGKVFRA